MAQRVSIVCDDNLVRQIDEIAHEYQLPRQEVLRQLLTNGLNNIDR